MNRQVSAGLYIRSGHTAGYIPDRNPQDPPQYTGEGYFDPWAYTNLGQKPKLGGVRISHLHYIHVHTLISVVGVPTFSLYYPCRFTYFSRFLLVCLKNLKKNKE